MNARRKPDGNGDWGDFEPSGGLTTTKHGGVDYSVYDKRERFQLNGNAEVRYTDTDNDWSSIETNLLPGGDVHNVQQGINRNSNLSVSTNHYFKFKFHDYRSFSISPWFDYTRTDSRSHFMNGAFSQLPSDSYTDVLDSLYSPNWTTTLRNLIRRNTQETLGETRKTEGGASFWSFFRDRYTVNGFSIEADVNFSDIRRENFDHFSYHHYAEDGTLQADIRNRYNASPEKSWGVRGMAKYFWHWTDDIMFNPNYTLNYDYMSGDCMRYRLEVLDESKDQALGWLPSQAAHLLQALDRDNSYESDYQRYRHMLTLDWQWNKQEGKGDTYSSWYLQLKPYFIVEQNNFDFRSFTSPQRVKKTYNLAQNAFGVRAFYDKQTGVRTTQPVNINGNWNLGLNSGYSMPLDKQKRLMLNNTTYMIYYHSVDFSTTQADMDPVRTAMKALWIEEELNLNYRFNKVNVGVLGAFSYGHIVTDRTDFTEVNT